jgi:hypothetical protein
VRVLNFSQQFRDEQLSPDYLTSESAVAFVNSTEVRKSMKSRSCLFVGALACLCAVGSYAGTVDKFQANGVSATATLCSNNNCFPDALITLLQSQGGGQNLYYVYFDIYGADSQGNLTDINAAGQIPASMVSGNGQSNLVLNLDTNAAGLDVEYCVIDQNFNHTCTPYAGGIMNVTWQKTGQYTNTNTGINTMTFTNFTVKTNFRNTTSSATAQGTIFGTQYGPGGDFTQLGTGHNGGIEIDKP